MSIPNITTESLDSAFLGFDIEYPETDMPDLSHEDTLRLVGRLAVRNEALVVETVDLGVAIEDLKEEVVELHEVRVADASLIANLRGEATQAQTDLANTRALLKSTAEELTAANESLRKELATSKARADIGDRLRLDLRECALRAEHLSHSVGNSLRDLTLGAKGQPPSLRKLAQVRKRLREAAVHVLAIHGRASGS